MGRPRQSNEIRLTDHPDWRMIVAQACTSADYSPEQIREAWRYVEKHHHLHPIDLERLIHSAHEDTLAKISGLVVIKAPA